MMSKESQRNRADEVGGEIGPLDRARIFLAGKSRRWKLTACCGCCSFCSLFIFLIVYCAIIPAVVRSVAHDPDLINKLLERARQDPDHAPKIDRVAATIGKQPGIQAALDVSFKELLLPLGASIAASRTDAIVRSESSSGPALIVVPIPDIQASSGQPFNFQYREFIEVRELGPLNALLKELNRKEGISEQRGKLFLTTRLSYSVSGIKMFPVDIARAVDLTGLNVEKALQAKDPTGKDGKGGLRDQLGISVKSATPAMKGLLGATLNIEVQVDNKSPLEVNLPRVGMKTTFSGLAPMDTNITNLKVSKQPETVKAEVSVLNSILDIGNLFSTIKGVAGLINSKTPPSFSIIGPLQVTGTTTDGKTNEDAPWISQLTDGVQLDVPASSLTQAAGLTGKGGAAGLIGASLGGAGSSKDDSSGKSGRGGFLSGISRLIGSALGGDKGEAAKNA